MGKYAVLSDIHGNLQALQSVYSDLNNRDMKINGILLLGDIIDYGMQSNECVHYISNEFEYPVLCNLWGNHERAIMLSDFTGFSSERGTESAIRTANKLESGVRRYLDENLVHEGYLEFDLDSFKCLAVHGSQDHPYWKAIFPDKVNGDYSEYDIVFSGHSHYSHMFTKFYHCKDEKMRNKHAVLFINPGSVGQPRNHHPQAQYVIFDTDTRSADLRSVDYDIEKAASYFDGTVDDFYRRRLFAGV